MNPFDEFDLDMVKITNANLGVNPLNEPDTSGSGTSSGPIATITCFTSCTPPCPSDLTCPSVDRCPSQDPKCQTLEGRCE